MCQKVIQKFIFLSCDQIEIFLQIINPNTTQVYFVNLILYLLKALARLKWCRAFIIESENNNMTFYTENTNVNNFRD